MASLLIKPLVAVATVGTVGIGGYYGGKLLIFKSEEKSKFSVALLLAKDKSKVLLTKEDSSEGPFWKGAWRAYREANKKAKVSKDPWSIDGFKGGYDSAISDEKAPDSFVEKCLSLSREMVDGVESDEYIQASSWCTRDYKVVASSFLDSDNKILLTNSTPNSDGLWKAAWEVYRKEHLSTSGNPWNIKTWDSQKNLQDQNAPEDFVTRCATEAAVLVPSKESQEYKNIFKYCTKNK